MLQKKSVSALEAASNFNKNRAETLDQNSKIGYVHSKFGSFQKKVSRVERVKPLKRNSI